MQSNVYIDEEDIKASLESMFNENSNQQLQSFAIIKNVVDEAGYVTVGEVKTNKNKYWFTHDFEYLIIYDHDKHTSANDVYNFYLSLLQNVADESEIRYGEAERDEEFIKALGRMTLAFAHLEFSLSLFCGTYSGVKYPINEIITAQFSFKQLINLASSLYHHAEQDAKKINELDKVLSKSTQLEQERNKIVHSFYGLKGKSDLIVVRQKNTTRLKKGFHKQYEEMNAEQVNILATKISKVSKEINAFIYQHGETNEPKP
jgi:hypothetical protein